MAAAGLLLQPQVLLPLPENFREVQSQLILAGTPAVLPSSSCIAREVGGTARLQCRGLCLPFASEVGYDAWIHAAR